MTLQCEKKIENVIKSGPGRLVANLGASLVISALMGLAFVGTAARATILLDPEPEDSTSLFGRAFAVIPDVNSDGVPDLVVGAPYQDGDFVNIDMGFGPPQNVGKVWVLSGADPSVIITQLNDPEFQMSQPQKFGGQFGSAIASAGDVNGDGIPDVIVGAPHHVFDPFNEDTGIAFSVGRAFILSGKTDTVLRTLDNPIPEENARAGLAVAGLGDVNSDGVPDVAIGSPGQDIGDEEDGLTDVGVVYVYSGANGGLIRTLNHPDQAVNARFGFALAKAGDVNGDGANDLLVGSPGSGQAFVFSGKTGAIIFTINSPVVERERSFGFAVAGDKDLDDDGKPDFAIGAPLLKNSSGAAFLFKGSDGTLLRRVHVPTTQKYSKFGAAVALIGDVTGDGRADVFVGAPEQDVNSLINAGQAYIYRGSNGTLFQTLNSETPQAFAGFGWAFGTADFDGNGTPSPIVGVPYQNAEIPDQTGDLVTHLQIGQIEIQ